MHTLQLSVMGEHCKQGALLLLGSVTITAMPDAAATPSPIQTLFNDIIDRRPFGDPWMASLWQAAARTRPGTASKQPASLGTLLEDEAPSERTARQGKVFDFAPSPPRLRSCAGCSNIPKR